MFDSVVLSNFLLIWFDHVAFWIIFHWLIKNKKEIDQQRINTDIFVIQLDISTLIDILNVVIYLVIFLDYHVNSIVQET